MNENVKKVVARILKDIQVALERDCGRGGISGRTGSETAYRDGLGRCSQRGQSVQGRGVGGV